MRAHWADICGVVTILILVAIFFGRLFYPVPQLIVTPDYGRSDAWHFSFPTKYALAESLTENKLPLWRNDIGGGFPLFAEGQTGALFIPNLLLFKALPAVPAYNAALASAIALLGVGTYGLLRALNYSPVAALLAGITIAFSGLAMSQLPHITLLQGIGMLPVVVHLSILTAMKPTPVRIGFLAFSVSQQIYAGFPQASFLALSLAGVIVASMSMKAKNWPTIATWLAAVCLGIGGGAAQLIPSWEFLQASTNPGGFTPQTATAYSMPVQHLITFLDPFALGNPQLGTYPPFYNFDGSIFWENTAYVGLLPLVLALGSILLNRQNKPPLLWIGIFIVSLTLAAGKYAPTYIIYSIWPLTLFRVPSRFLWVSIAAITVIAAHVVDVIRASRTWKKSINLLLVALILGHTLQLMGTWWSYHLIAPAMEWMKTPETARHIENGRVMTLGEGKIHNDVMAASGWVDKEHFAFLRNGLSPDSNMLWNISQYDVYAGRFLKRPSITDSLLADTIALSPAAATISATKLMDVYSISHLLSYIPVDSKELTLLDTVSRETATLRHYKNDDALPRAYVVYEATTAATLSQAASILGSSSFIPGRTVLLENHAVDAIAGFPELLANNRSAATQPTATVSWQENRHASLTLRVDTEQPGFLVLADTYYPGWHAYINGHETAILAANLSQRAIALPKGTHTVKFIYTPSSLTLGGNITLISLCITALLITLPIVVQALHTRKTVHGRAPRRPSTHRKLPTPS